MNDHTQTNGRDDGPTNGVAKDSAQQCGGPKFSAKPDDVRPKPKRFYQDVRVKALDDGFVVLLDERVVKTPLKADLLLRSERLAEAIAGEWAGQQEEIELEGMILTKLANTAIDRVAPRRDVILDEISGFSEADLVCYRAEEPASLVEREDRVWAPYLDWLQGEHGVSLKTTSGIMHAAQEPDALLKIRGLFSPFDDFALTAGHNLITLTGSCVLALGLLYNRAPAEDIWQAAHVDEDFQIERWGEDLEAKRRRELRGEEFLKTYDFYRLSVD